MKLLSVSLNKNILCFFLLTFFLTIGITGWGQVIQDEKRVIFLIDTPILYDFTKEKPQQRFTPTLSEIDSADLLLKIYFQTLDSADGKSFQADNYFRQYVGLWVEGQNVIFVTASCYKPDYFLENTLYPRGGGKCFFRAIVDTESKKVKYFSFNAPK